MSLPSRGRGLKYLKYCYRLLHELVAPFTGAWIEIGIPAVGEAGYKVAPFTGAWIEIQYG